MAIATLTSGESGANSLIDINANFVDLDTTKADLASPTFTGTPTLPTGTIAVTQTAGDNSTKVATTAYVSGLFTVETTAAATHSLTTTAGQRVIVWATTNTDFGSIEQTVELKYNGVTKDSAVIDSDSGSNQVCALMYTETPGAATADITVTSGGSLLASKIIVLKF